MSDRPRLTLKRAEELGLKAGSWVQAAETMRPFMVGDWVQLSHVIPESGLPKVEDNLCYWRDFYDPFPGFTPVNEVKVWQIVSQVCKKMKADLVQSNPNFDSEWVFLPQLSRNNVYLGAQAMLCRDFTHFDTVIPAGTTSRVTGFGGIYVNLRNTEIQFGPIPYEFLLLVPETPLTEKQFYNLKISDSVRIITDPKREHRIASLDANAQTVELVGIDDLFHFTRLSKV